MNNDQLLKIVEHFSRKSDSENKDVKVIKIPDFKSVFIEENGGIGQAIMMTEYKVDGLTYRAGYSMHSETVYISLAA